MKKLINFKFIIVSTLTYVPFTILCFFWHNNLFPGIYYVAGSTNSINSINSQNIWAMNFANALLVYGFVYFYFKASPPQSPQKGEGRKDIKLINAVLWGVYYSISAIGFYSFLNFGMISNWRVEVLIYDMVFAVIGGVIAGVLVYYLYKRFHPSDRLKRSDG